jgi:putative membrane protein
MLKNNIMKTLNASFSFANYFLCLALGLTMLSCKDEGKKEEDSKDVAEKFNDAKFHKSKEADFLVDATDLCYEEIELARLAQSNGTSENIKEIGKTMEKDHTAFLEEIKKLAESKKITIPSEITAEGQKARKKLADESGTEFDKNYCEACVENHKKEIKKYMDAMEDCEDIEVKNYANKTLATLRDHLDHAMSCSQSFKEAEKEKKDKKEEKESDKKDKKNTKEKDRADM